MLAYICDTLITCVELFHVNLPSVVHKHKITRIRSLVRRVADKSHNKWELCMSSICVGSVQEPSKANAPKLRNKNMIPLS